MNIGLYIHIPFCHRRCNYCDFYLTTNLNLVNPFTAALQKEIELYSNEYKDRIVDSIFFGGGTPSLLSLSNYDKIFRCLRNRLKISDNAEITIECNPEDIIKDKSKFKSLAEFGVNRISLGVQSFIDSELTLLTRMHNSIQALESVHFAKEILDNVSVDIIYALKNQTIDDIEFNLSKISELNLNHISAYTLIIEKGSIIYKQYEKNNQLEFAEKNSDVFYEHLSKSLVNRDFSQYEVSNYAKQGYESKHNLKYWNFEDYLGLGPSSHSFVNKQRFINVKSVNGYITKLNSNELPILEKSDLTLSQLKNDYFISVFRSNGVDLKKYHTIFNEDFIAVYHDLTKHLIKLNLASLSETHFKLTQKGFALADEITLKFFKL